MKHTSSLFLLILLVSYSAASDFKWSDCGVQLTKDIHYESATISAGLLGGGPLSINVEATIVNTIYNAQTQLVVYKDGDLFLNVQIQDLCDILTTSTLSCPLQPGRVSFTHTFSKIPALPRGSYEFQIRSFSNYIGVQVNNAEQGCLSLTGTAGSIVGAANTYTSSFAVTLTGAPTFQGKDYTARKAGDPISVGASGVYGQFASTLKATPDIAPAGFDLSGFEWALSGSLTNITINGNMALHSYAGTFQVYKTTDEATPFMQGTVSLVNTIDTTIGGIGQTTGTLTFSPKYAYSTDLVYPVVIGNMDPIQITLQSDGSSWVVSGSHTWCTAGLDGCGVCGGDGRTCGLGASANSGSTAWSNKQKAAVAIGVGGGVLGLIAITVLAIMIKRARRTPYYNDADLIDHPQKPDYGTMAIDDIMREGERAPY